MYENSNVIASELVFCYQIHQRQTLNQTVEVYLSFLVYLEESANDESAVDVQLAGDIERTLNMLLRSTAAAYINKLPTVV